MKIDANEKELAALVAYERSDYEEAEKLEDEFLEVLRKSLDAGEDHCSCPRPCRHHGNCLECVALHRAHRDHLPYCFFDIINERLYGLSALTEQTLIGKIKEKRKKKETISAEEKMETIEVNGVQLHYQVEGEGKPVFLVHGCGGSHKDFHVEINQLTEAGYRVYALDSRGQGANAPLDEYHYADMMEDVYQVITYLGLKRPAFYGWSDGGVIGLMLEIAHPGTVGLMAISGTNLTSEGMRPDVIAYYKKIYEESPTPLYKMMLTEPDIDTEKLKNIDIPVLVTAGSEDGILETDTRLIAESIPDSKLIILEGEDHGSYIVDSEIMGNLLLDFFRDHHY